MKNITTKEITFLGVMIAMVTVASYFGVRNPLSEGGYVHLGTLVALVIAMRYGKFTGAIAGGIGMMLFDIFSTYSHYALITLITRLIMGFAVGYIAYNSKTNEQGTSLLRNSIALIVGMIIMLTGYFIGEAYFLYDISVAVKSIVGNVLQFVIGALSLYLVPKLIKYEEVYLDQ